MCAHLLIPSREPGDGLVTSKRINGYECTLKSPFNRNTLDPYRRKLLSAHVATYLGMNTEQVQDELPQVLLSSGKCVMDASETDTLTSIAAHNAKGEDFARDATFVEYDMPKYTRRRDGTTDIEAILSFGRIDRIVSFRFKHKTFIIFIDPSPLRNYEI